MRIHVLISGRVQGVGFRHFTRKNAQELGIKGWVKNRADGKVEAVFEGSKEAVEQMTERCRQGPFSAKVGDLQLKEVEEKEPFRKFEVRY